MPRWLLLTLSISGVIRPVTDPSEGIRQCGWYGRWAGCDFHDSGTAVHRHTVAGLRRGGVLRGQVKGQVCWLVQGEVWFTSDQQSMCHLCLTIWTAVSPELSFNSTLQSRGQRSLREHPNIIILTMVLPPLKFRWWHQITRGIFSWLLVALSAFPDCLRGFADHPLPKVSQWIGSFQFALMKMWPAPVRFPALITLIMCHCYWTTNAPWAAHSDCAAAAAAAAAAPSSTDSHTDGETERCLSRLTHSPRLTHSLWSWSHNRTHPDNRGLSCPSHYLPHNTHTDPLHLSPHPSSPKVIKTVL